ncbi:MAG: hypothetical protein U0521_26315 [Anaerolineae bacterium]
METQRVRNWIVGTFVAIALIVVSVWALQAFVEGGNISARNREAEYVRNCQAIAELSADQCLAIRQLLQTGKY